MKKERKATTGNFLILTTEKIVSQKNYYSFLLDIYNSVKTERIRLDERIRAVGKVYIV